MAKQNNRHQAGKRPEITRDIYNTVRKYDRRSFEDWADHIYDCGYEDGKAQAVISIKKDARAADQQRPAKPTGTKYTAAEDSAILIGRATGKGYKEIGARIGRSAASVQARADRKRF